MSFVKWVGGKAQLVSTLMEHFPREIDTYHEPFVGGGSVLIHVLELCERKEMHVKEFVVSDINSMLIECYRSIQTCPEQLMGELDVLATRCTNAEEYYILRDEYNAAPTPALFITLNKTCFRGLYRVNRKGQFNTPYGNYKSPTIYKRTYIERLHVLFTKYKVQFHACAYDAPEVAPSSNAFMYLDPPYVKLNTASFDTYTADTFDHATFFRYVRTLPCVSIMSNSDTLLVRSEFAQYAIIELEGVRRRVNSKNPASVCNELLVIMNKSK